MLPRVMVLSLWRNDVERDLDTRMDHLLALEATTHAAALRFVWVVGDSVDATEQCLRYRASTARRTGQDVRVERFDTGIEGEAYGPTPNRRGRMLRGSVTFSAGLDQVLPDDDYVLLCESDLHVPPNLIDRLLTSGKCPVAGWVVLGSATDAPFYDSWGYLGLDGQHFDNWPPYHSAYRSGEAFEVASVGSCVLMHADDIRAGVRCETQGVHELSEKLRARGRRIWVLPDVRIEQPLHTFIWQVGHE